MPDAASTPDPATGAPGTDAGPSVQSYCDACGARWQASWTACPRCERARAADREAVRLEATERRPLRAPLLLYFLMLGVSGAMLVAARVAAPSAGITIEWAAEGLDAAIVLGACIAAWPDLRPALTRRPGWYWFPAAVAAAAVTFGLAHLLVEFARRSLGIQESEGVVAPALASGYGWAAVVVSVALQPALVEELAFRGIILPGLIRVMPLAGAVAASSLMFMVLHLTPLAFPHLLLIGVLLALLRVASGSLYPGMVMHFTHNLLVAVNEHHPLLRS